MTSNPETTSDTTPAETTQAETMPDVKMKVLNKSEHKKVLGEYRTTKVLPAGHYLTSRRGELVIYKKV